MSGGPSGWQGGSDALEAALAQVGDRWTFLVLREAFFGTRRFTDLQSHLGIARNLLTDRLRRLVEDGLLERRQYQERPVRHEYRLTDKGRDLYPTIVALKEWADRWLDVDVPVELRHADDDGAAPRAPGLRQLRPGGRGPRRRLRVPPPRRRAPPRALIAPRRRHVASHVG